VIMGVDTVSTLAGKILGAGITDGFGTNAQFCNPVDLALSSAGILYVSEAACSSIRNVNVATGQFWFP
jgi:hypothetical protein